MNIVTCAAPDGALESARVIERVTTGLRDFGYVVVDGWLDDRLVGDLVRRCRVLAAQGQLAPAGMGRGGLRVEDERYRRTSIRWIEPPLTDAESSWLEHCESLRSRLNEHLLLGLNDCECHYSVYPTGGFYRRHVDRFLTDDRRTVSCVLYLNDDWTAADGGALRLYQDLDGDEPLVDVLPRRGRLVAFLSDRFAHEVLPTQRERCAIAGWFRRRPLGKAFV